MRQEDFDKLKRSNEMFAQLLNDGKSATGEVDSSDSSDSPRPVVQHRR